VIKAATNKLWVLTDRPFEFELNRKKFCTNESYPCSLKAQPSHFVLRADLPPHGPNTAQCTGFAAGHLVLKGNFFVMDPLSQNAIRSASRSRESLGGRLLSVNTDKILSANAHRAAGEGPHLNDHTGELLHYWAEKGGISTVD